MLVVRDMKVLGIDKSNRVVVVERLEGLEEVRVGYYSVEELYNVSYVRLKGVDIHLSVENDEFILPIIESSLHRLPLVYSVEVNRCSRTLGGLVANIGINDEYVGYNDIPFVFSSYFSRGGV